MTKKSYDKIADGLTEAISIARGEWSRRMCLSRRTIRRR